MCSGWKSEQECEMMCEVERALSPGMRAMSHLDQWEAERERCPNLEMMNLGGKLSHWLEVMCWPRDIRDPSPEMNQGFLNRVYEVMKLNPVNSKTIELCGRRVDVKRCTTWLGGVSKSLAR